MVDRLSRGCDADTRLTVPPDGHEEAIARRLKALADPTRLRLLAVLAAHQPRPVCVCDLVEPLGVSQPTVSHHLKVLAGEGFVIRHKRGTWAYFTLADPSVLEAVRSLGVR